MSLTPHSPRRISDAPRYQKPSRLSPLQTLRLAKNLRQRDVAAKVGTGESVVCLWETFAREPSDQHRRAYSRVLGITVGELGRIIYEAGIAKRRVRSDR